MTPGGREKMKAWLRLHQCIELIGDSEPVPEDDLVWIADILQNLRCGIDMRPMFLDSPTRGRSETANDREFWMAIDALFEFVTTGNKGKALWGALAKRWGGADGSIRNAIARRRLDAEDMFANLPWDHAQNIEHLRKILPDIIDKHKNSRN
jgi:hypothetical protein